MSWQAEKAREVGELRQKLQAKQEAAVQLEAASRSAGASLEQRAVTAEARLSEAEVRLESQISLVEDLHLELDQVRSKSNNVFKYRWY